MDQDILAFGCSFEEARGAFSAAEIDLYTDLLGHLVTIYDCRLQSVKLVGSRARGTTLDGSDYDFLVFLDECNYDIEVPKLKELGVQVSQKHALGPLSLSPLSREQFLGLDAKYDGITGNSRRDAVTLWPDSGQCVSMA